MPAQTKFKIAEDEQPNVVTAANELKASMEAIVGERNLKEYGSLEELEKKYVTKIGKVLVRMLRNTIELAKKQVATISEKLHDPTKKTEILAYLSSAIGTKNAEVLEESYQRLQNTAMKADKWCKNPNHSVTFFERHNASVPPPRLGIKRPIVLVNKKDPLMLKISLKGLSQKVQEYVDKGSSDGIISEIYDVLMRAIISQAGNTNDLFPLPRVENEQGFFLGSIQLAHNHFISNPLLAKPATCVEAIYPDDTAVRDILNKTHTEPLTNEMRSEAKKRLQNPQDEYFQRKTGKRNSSLEEQQAIKNAITWVFTGSERDFNASKFFYDPFYRADSLTTNTDSVAIILRDIGGEVVHQVRSTGDLFSNKEFQAFDKIKQAVLEEFNSLGKIVSDLARHLIFEKTGLDLDPKDIFLVQFKNNGTVVDKNCITGYAHYSEPLSFQNLVEVLNDNFLVFSNRKTESISNMLSSYAAQFVAAGNYPLSQSEHEEETVLFSGPDKVSGLYLGVNSTTRAFNNENEIKYLPSQLRADITNLDVMQQVTQRLDAFWGKHAEDWRNIAKGEFVAKLRLTYAKGAISKKGYEAAMKGGASNILLYDTAKVDEISEHSFPDRSVQVSFLSLDLQGQAHLRPVRYSYKTDIVCFTDQEGREILYIPRSDKPFLEFQTKQELQKWLVQQIGDNKRDELLQNVSKRDRLKVEPLLRMIPRNSLFFRDHLSILILELAKENINQDLFSALAERTEKRSHDDADTTIRSNGEAVLGTLSLGLTLTNLIISPFLPILGPLGLGIGLSLSSAQIITNILRLHSADTPEESSDAEMNIGMDLLFLFFDGISGIASKPFLKSGTSARKPAVSIQKKLQGSLHDIHPIGGNSLSGKGAITAKGVQVPQGQKPFGTQLNFPYIDEVIDLEAISNTKKYLQQKLFSQVSQSAELVRFRDNPKDACFWAISSVQTALKEQGEKSQVVALLFYKNPWDKEPINHYASMLKKDGVTYIIDPTIRQFDPSLPNESTILTLQEWNAEMLAKPGAGKDKMVIMGTYDTILQARDNLADPLVSFKNYYEMDLFNNYNVRFIKYGNSLFNSIIIERRNIIEKMHTLSENAVLNMENFKQLQTLNLLKTQFKIIDPNEIEITAQISNAFKSAIKKYSVPTSEIPALNSIADYKDITSTFSGENYIRVNANGWIKIEKAEDSNYFLIYQKQKVQLMHFETNRQRWVFSDL